QRLADHQGAGQCEEKDERMKDPGADGEGAAVEVVADAALPGGEGEDGDEDDARGNRRALEVLDLPRFPGEFLRGDVEAREPAHAAAEEIDERDPIPAAVETGRDAERSGRDAERDHVRERVELAAERGMLVPHARDASV